MATNCQRQWSMIIDLSIYRKIQISVWMERFNVSRSTIKRDISIISSFVPVFSLKGRSGGVCVPDDWVLGNKYLTDEQVAFLRSVMDYLPDEESKEKMVEIITLFAKPKPEKK